MKLQHIRGIELTAKSALNSSALLDSSTAPRGRYLSPRLALQGLELAVKQDLQYRLDVSAAVQQRAAEKTD